MNKDLDTNSDDILDRALNWLRICPVESSAPDAEEADILEHEDFSIFPDIDRVGQDTATDPSGPQLPQQSNPNHGEIPTVENRLHKLIKDRMQIEIADRLPLFPWESSLMDYETELDSPLWLPQLLQLPYRVPEDILVRILQACLSVVANLEPQVAKLVKAVDFLFPGDIDLSDRAYQVMPVRDAGEVLSADLDYTTADYTQQKLISLLTAKEILQRLTLVVGARQRQQHKQWQTSSGNIDILLQYVESPGRARLEVWLPNGGRITIATPTSPISVDSNCSGRWTSELTNLVPGRLYPLTIQLSQAEQVPLRFAIGIAN